MMITYRHGNDIDLERYLGLYRNCSLGQRRPLDDPARMAAMLDNANLVVTAWDAEQLVGIARAVSDFAYATYLADLAVRTTHQGQGIGKQLLRETQAAAPQAKIILLAAPTAESYYPHLQVFTPHPHCWILFPDNKLD